MLVPSVHPLLWLFVLFPGETALAPHGGGNCAGGGIWGARLHGGHQGEPARGLNRDELPSESSAFKSRGGRVTLLGKMWPYQVYRVYLAALG